MKFFFTTFLFAVTLAIFTQTIAAQIDASNRPMNDRGGPEEPPKGVKEMLWKQRAEKEKKEYAELLQRGEDVLKLSSEVETSYNKNRGLTREDRAKLQTIEKLVEKVRRSLGGSSDGTDKVDTAEISKTVDVVSMLKSLKTETETLVTELKKSTRFTVSALAIETSNSVLKVVRFLRNSR